MCNFTSHVCWNKAAVNSEVQLDFGEQEMTHFSNAKISAVITFSLMEEEKKQKKLIIWWEFVQWAKWIWLPKNMTRPVYYFKIV